MTQLDLHDRLINAPVRASAPGRIDMGGTLDIKTFYLLLRDQAPCTFNMALRLRTRVELRAWQPGRICITSRGFESAVFAPGTAPLNHPLGLMFAITSFFGVSGVEVRIDSDLPPRSGLGGSSAAAVALIGALNQVCTRAGRSALNIAQIVELAHALEEAVAGHLCGQQDQLAAAWGGMHLWHWRSDLASDPTTEQKPARESFDAALADDIAQHTILAYTGQPHTSYDINSRWIQQFAAGTYRGHWQEIIECVRHFAQALRARDYAAAAAMLHRETTLRSEMTPEVLNPTGQALAAAAQRAGGGARFTGAGGGGCLWAMAPAQAISRIREDWQALLTGQAGAVLLPIEVDLDGLAVLQDKAQ